jgi:hypothetical protein
MNQQEIDEVRRLLNDADIQFEKWLSSLDWIDSVLYANDRLPVEREKSC